MMNNVTPSNSYDLLTSDEQAAADEYVLLLSVECQRRGERIANVLNRPIPAELVKRSRGLLSRALVLSAIAEKLQTLANNQDISPSRVIREHAHLAFSNMADYVRFGQFGELIIDLRNCTREQMAAVKTIKITETPMGRKTEFSLHDKQPSLAALQSVMTMPQIAESPNGSGAARIAKGENAEKAYSNLLESMRSPS